jgi:3-phenylpropionate/trans-cinnamate dioxygenase ferredoxin reductase subunit
MPHTTKYLLIGGGVASVNAAKGIREHDQDGRLILATANDKMPYDRPPLSKGFLSNPEVTHDDISSKFDNWYPDNKVEVMLHMEAVKLDRASKTVTFANGEEIVYEKLLIATGSSAKDLEVAGTGTPLFTLRTIEDAENIREKLADAKSVVVIGTGYLGPEAAAQAHKKGLKTTIVGQAGHIWDQFGDEALGAFLNNYYREKGIDLILEDSVAALEPGKVRTKSGKEIQADLVLAAVGGAPNVELARAAGLPIDEKDSGIVANDRFQTSDPAIYVAGDVAHFPDHAMGRGIRHEHHLNAQWQGAVAGANMAGADKPYERVSYFFSDFLDLHMIQRGSIPVGDKRKTVGDLQAGEFIQLYGDDSGTLKMGISISHEEKKLDPISDKLEEMILAKKKLDEISDSDFAG